MKKTLMVVYLSTSGNTKRMADAIAAGADSRGINSEVVSFYDVDLDKLRSADAIAIGSSTFWYKMHDAMEKFLDRLKPLKLEGKVGAAFGSYGWSGEAPVQIAQKMRELGLDVIDPVLRVQWDPEEKDLKECERLGKDIAKALKKEPVPVA
ncbi:flavodoxin domain-containing protein [Methanocella arvoryzae]|uniref:Predicted flavodoxin n=1 Tax=Methanocella arvoryzae (strain DSM 22066 / NBRC 105507 / MRE50) TaxID=351160 RepID=Q0W169_METAR|nr:flavodoxin domain-containing protein [Methanocella arvoryzae]CAJ37874.1 predicted flavodoxin [Methanocella arvoryzae MRE50]